MYWVLQFFCFCIIASVVIKFLLWLFQGWITYWTSPDGDGEPMVEYEAANEDEIVYKKAA